MIKLNPVIGTYSANQRIPLTLVFNTNNSLNFVDNQIVIRKAGFLEIEGTITLIGTSAGDAQVQLIDENNNVLARETVSFTAIGDYATASVYDLLRIIYNNAGTYGKLSLRVNTGVTVDSGVLTGKYID